MFLLHIGVLRNGRAGKRIYMLPSMNRSMGLVPIGAQSGKPFPSCALAAQERAGGSQVGILYAISLTVVFLSLAALYESWSIPVAVILGAAIRAGL